MENEAVADAVGGLTGASQGGLEVKVPREPGVHVQKPGVAERSEGLTGMSPRPTHRVGEN